MLKELITEHWINFQNNFSIPIQYSSQLLSLFLLIEKTRDMYLKTWRWITQVLLSWWDQWTYFRSNYEELIYNWMNEKFQIFEEEPNTKLVIYTYWRWGGFVFSILTYLRIASSSFPLHHLFPNGFSC